MSEHEVGGATTYHYDVGVLGKALRRLVDFRKTRWWTAMGLVGRGLLDINDEDRVQSLIKCCGTVGEQEWGSFC